MHNLVDNCLFGVNVRMEDQKGTFCCTISEKDSVQAHKRLSVYAEETSKLSELVCQILLLDKDIKSFLEHFFVAENNFFERSCLKDSKR